jgi:hypothetical protein
MHYVFGTNQQRHVPVDDDALETVIYKNQGARKERREGFDRSPPQIFWSDNQNHLSWRPVESTASLSLLCDLSPGIARAQPLVMY